MLASFRKFPELLRLLLLFVLGAGLPLNVGASSFGMCPTLSLTEAYQSAHHIFRATLEKEEKLSRGGREGVLYSFQVIERFRNSKFEKLKLWVKTPKSPHSAHEPPIANGSEYLLFLARESGNETQFQTEWCVKKHLVVALPAAALEFVRLAGKGPKSGKDELKSVLAQAKERFRETQFRKCLRDKAKKRSDCYERFEKCDLLEEIVERDKCFGANRQCNKVASLTRRDACYSQQRQCKQVSSQSVRDKCYLSIFKCGKVTDSEARGSCYHQNMRYFAARLGLRRALEICQEVVGKRKACVAQIIQATQTDPAHPPHELDEDPAEVNTSRQLFLNAEETILLANQITDAEKRVAYLIEQAAHITPDTASELQKLFDVLPDQAAKTKAIQRASDRFTITNPRRARKYCLMIPKEEKEARSLCLSTIN